MIPTPIPAVINHLLSQEPWALARLTAHAGKITCLDTGLFALRLKVAPDGLVQAADADAPANVTIRVRPADLPLILQNRERAFSWVTIEGDADFANTISQLSQSLQWEAEEDLSRLFGDVAAARVVAGVRSVADSARSTGRNLAENLAEYFLEENPMLIRPSSLAEFTSEVTRLRDDVERLAKRIGKIT